jgi:hypothetical protein
MSREVGSAVVTGVSMVAGGLISGPIARALELGLPARVAIAIALGLVVGAVGLQIVKRVPKA